MSFPVLALITALAAVNGSGTPKTEARSVEAFTAVESGGSWNVQIAKGDKVTVEVSGDDNIVPLITTQVKDGALVIACRESSLNTKLPVVVKITMPSIARLQLAGAGNASISGVPATKLALHVSGSGNASWQGDADDVTIKSTGAGQTALKGKGKSLSAEASGAGSVDAAGFEVATATVKATGAGNVAVHATTSLDVTASGAGNVVYTGAPKLTKKTSGAGTVRAASEVTGGKVKAAAQEVKKEMKDAAKAAKKATGGW